MNGVLAVGGFGLGRRCDFGGGLLDVGELGRLRLRARRFRGPR